MMIIVLLWQELAKHTNLINTTQTAPSTPQRGKNINLSRLSCVNCVAS